jgi:hypothetical protein
MKSVQAVYKQRAISVRKILERDRNAFTLEDGGVGRLNVHSGE